MTRFARAAMVGGVIAFLSGTGSLSAQAPRAPADDDDPPFFEHELPSPGDDLSFFDQELPPPGDDFPFFDQEPPRHGPGMMEGLLYHPSSLLNHREALELTTEQVTRLSNLETELKQARDKAGNDAKTHADELQKLWDQDAPDVSQVRTHAQAMMQAEQAARLATITGAAQAKSILTSEQRGRVQGWADHRGHRMGMRGFRDGMRGFREGMRGFRWRGMGDGPDGPRFRYRYRGPFGGGRHL